MGHLRSWPGTWRPVWVAATFTGRSAETFRTWAKNGKLASRKDGKTGELLIDLVQAVRLHETTPRRFRRLTVDTERPASEAANVA